MRDLYNGKHKLEHWLYKAKSELDEPDRTHVLEFVEYMQEKDNSILWIVRCITALIYIRRQLDKPFVNCQKEDIKSLFRWMDTKNYKASTHEKFRKILKIFYKVVFGNNEFHPDSVSWFSTQIGKEKKSQERDLNIAEYLEENEVPILIDAAPTIQKKAFLACMYESGARPEEFLRLTNIDIKIDTDGAILFLRGKTGERRVRIVSFAKLLQQWLEIHPLKDNYQFPLWISQATNYKNDPLGLRGAQKIIEEALDITNLNKHKRLYLLRHSRATHLCKHLTDAQMCVFFGWTIGTKVVRRYIHLSGKDLDNTLLSIGQGLQIEQ
jgi:integrase/recombinase XerD